MNRGIKSITIKGFKSTREIDKFELKNFNILICENGSDFPIEPYYISDESLRFIALARALLQPHKSFIIIYR